jgi:hypothetical protein
MDVIYDVYKYNKFVKSQCDFFILDYIKIAVKICSRHSVHSFLVYLPVLQQRHICDGFDSHSPTRVVVQKLVVVAMTSSME